MADGADIQAALLKMTGQRSVPNVFVNKEHIGGNDDTQASFRNGSLETKLGLSK
jgi:glutaredoxin 3